MDTRASCYELLEIFTGVDTLPRRISVNPAVVEVEGWRERIIVPNKSDLIRALYGKVHKDPDEWIAGVNAHFGSALSLVVDEAEPSIITYVFA